MQLIKIAFIIILLISSISAQCFHHPNNIYASLEIVECNWNSGLDVTDTSSHQEASEEMFQVQFNCEIGDKVTCDKVLGQFKKAANMITSTFIFNTPIKVNVSYYDFCTVYPANLCGDLSGAAYPSQFYALQDDDGLTRLYPQSLVKQFKFSNAPKYNEFDINAEFNSVSNFWFEQDSIKINPDQEDIYWTICHELIHGLGFYNRWMGYQINPIALIPTTALINPDGSVPRNNLFNTNSSFVEFMMDKYTILLSNGTQISLFTRQLNTFFNDHKSSVFNDVFIKSPQFKFAQELLVLATTPNSLGLLPRNSRNFLSDAFILETSMPTFEQGTSLIHVDFKTYINTNDFLMTYRSVDGNNAKQMVLNGGNYSGGPIGPRLKLMMETFGYATAENPNPYKPLPFKPSPTPDVTSKSNETINHNASSGCTLYIIKKN
ncbi:15697_t:CDS:2 [Funneliformis mosseae]|uniref:15697_t:CDS:1 n=1 Tax=Funneliformis mosseae TaxID=27381 RepID=A0A9N8WL91_FUNMO|nr:15697_t:CDS:2 [Funneliformis mosseae]